MEGQGHTQVRSTDQANYPSACCPANQQMHDQPINDVKAANKRLRPTACACVNRVMHTSSELSILHIPLYRCLYTVCFVEHDCTRRITPGWDDGKQQQKMPWQSRRQPAGSIPAGSLPAPPHAPAARTGCPDPIEVLLLQQTNQLG